MNKQETRTPSDTKSRFYYGYIIVITSFILVMVNVGLYVSVGVFFKPITIDLGWTRAVTSGPISISGLVSGILSVAAGSLSDKFGPRRIVTVCALLTGAGYLLMSHLDSIWQLYLYFGIMIGTSTSIITPLLSVIPRWFTGRRTIIVGIISAGGGVGGLIMPLVTNWMISSYNWHRTYLIIGIAYLIFILTAAQFLKRGPAVAASQTSNQVNSPAVKAAAGSYSLKHALFTRPFWLMIILFFCFGFSALTVQVHLVPHATDINIDATAAAGLLSIMNGISIIGSIGLGAIGDKFGNKRLIVVTFILEAIALFSLVYIRNLWMLDLFAAVYGLAFGSGLAQTPPLVARYFGMGSLGLVFGLMSFCQTLGGSIGGFLAGYIFDASGGYQLAFMICAILGLVGLAATLLLKPAKNPPEAMMLSNEA